MQFVFCAQRAQPRPAKSSVHPELSPQPTRQPFRLGVEAADSTSVRQGFATTHEGLYWRPMQGPPSKPQGFATQTINSDKCPACTGRSCPHRCRPLANPSARSTSPPPSSDADAPPSRPESSAAHTPCPLHKHQAW
ncbi:hypothetical protein SDC9_141028 [bioreactor metagenome]|uniref:Uncharacterized protein n=1 Tax=bioreactor metagenome TaxID=1076179 RepID=A0A645DX15_9ZZZZ